MIAKNRWVPVLAVILMAMAMLCVAAQTVLAEEDKAEVRGIYVSITRPESGESFEDAISNVDILGDGFTVKNIEWCENYDYDENGELIAVEDGNNIGDHGVFNPKWTYRLIVELEADDGYVFPYESEDKTNMLSKAIIKTYSAGKITDARELSDDRKNATFVITGIKANLTVNIARPATEEETAPSVSLPEFEDSWYKVTGAEWYDPAAGTVSKTRTFATNETAYVIVHLEARDSKYECNTPTKLAYNSNYGTFIRVSNKTKADKLDITYSVKAAAPRESLGDIVIDLGGEGTMLSGNELEAVTLSMREFGKAGIVSIPNYQALDLNNDGDNDVFYDNMTSEDGSPAYMFYTTDDYDLGSELVFDIPEEIRGSLMEEGNAYCDKIIFTKN